MAYVSTVITRVINPRMSVVQFTSPLKILACRGTIVSKCKSQYYIDRIIENIEPLNHIEPIRHKFHIEPALARSVTRCWFSKDFFLFYLVMLYFLTQVTGVQNPGSVVSVIVRGSNKLVLEEAERSIHDALCVIRCLVKKR